MVIALALLVSLGAIWASARAAVTVCLVEVREGKARVTRGGLAPGILSDIEDILVRPTIARATLRIVRSGGLARLEVKGTVSEAQRQQLRNVVGSVPLAKLARLSRGSRRT
jgi:hypothetical protein